jgi:hypothetical protein
MSKTNPYIHSAFQRTIAIIARLFHRNTFTASPAAVIQTEHKHMDQEERGRSVYRHGRAKVADQVASHRFGDLSVSFYLYAQDKVIRASALRHGVLKEAFFTLDTATQSDRPFTIAGAIDWMTNGGIQELSPSFSKRPLSITSVPPADISEPANIADRPSPQLSNSPEASANAEQADCILENSHFTPAASSRAFTGEIIEIGMRTRKELETKRSYETFVVKLRRAHAGIEREFFGIHLSEIASKRGLRTGMTVSIRLAGRRHWTVTNNGKEESRHRNEYEVLLKHSGRNQSK